MQNSNWYQFQEEICKYFQSLGFNAKTNVTIKGARTNHNIDVLVESFYLGIKSKWIIEAKKWTSPINKLQVLALRTIVEDSGVDKGFIICENGFQKGAYEASIYTNIHLLTFEQLKSQTKAYIEKESLKHYKNRISLLFRRYSSHNKFIREEYNLKLEHGDQFNSVFFILSTAERTIEKALLNNYPIDLHTGMGYQNGEELNAENIQQVFNWLNLNLNFVDNQIFEAEIKMQKNGDFNPILK